MKKSKLMVCAAVLLALPLGTVLSKAALAAQEQSSNRPFIIGGDDVAADDVIAKSTVMLVSTDGFLCTASIIADDLAVSAAHCVTNEDGSLSDPSKLRLVFRTTVKGKGPVVGVVSTAVPKGWKGANSAGKEQSDISIVHFLGGIPAGHSAAPLLASSSSLKKGESVTLAGYGITDAINQTGDGTLRKVQVEVADEFAKTEILFDQRNGRGACHGDSGGPAFAEKGGKLLLFGVTNRGYPDDGPDDCAQFSVYTRIDAYSAWIKKTADDLRSKDGNATTPKKPKKPKRPKGQDEPEAA